MDANSQATPDEPTPGGIASGRRLSLDQGRLLAQAALFACAYVGLAELGHYLSFEKSVFPFATCWPPSGLFLAMLALHPQRRWPWLVLCGVAANFFSDVVLHHFAPGVSLAFSTGNALEALLGAVCLQGWRRETFRLEGFRDLFTLTILASLVSPLVSAAIGATISVFILQRETFGHNFYIWWIADALGVVVVAPLICCLAEPSVYPRRVAWPRIAEGLVLYALLLSLSLGAFTHFWSEPRAIFKFPFLLFPLLIWAATSFGPLGACTASLAVSLIAVWGTTHGQGIIVDRLPDLAGRATALQFYLLVNAITPLLFAILLRRHRQAEVSLQQHVDTLKAVVRSTSDAVFVKNLAGRYTLVNEAGARILGKTLAEVEGRHDFELFQAATLASVRETDRQAIQDRQTVVQESTNNLSGESKFLISTKAAFRDLQGNALGTVGVVRDITAARQAAVALEQSERRFRTLASHSPFAILEGDADGNCIFANHSCCDLAELPEEELLGLGWARLIHPLDREHVISQRARFMASDEQELPLETRIITASGRLRHVITTTAVLRDAAGVRTGYLTSLADITDRKAAEALLAESEQRFRQMAESIGEIFWLRDIEPLRILYLNPAFERMTGMKCEEVYADPLAFLRVIHPDDQVRARSGLATAAERPYEIEYRFFRPDGVTRWVHVRVAPVRDEEGRVVRAVGVARDITERKDMERAVQEINSALERRVLERTAEIHRTNELLRQQIAERFRAEAQLAQRQTELAHVFRVSTLGQMGAELAHEVNQPLYAIHNYVRGTQARLERGAISLTEIAATLDLVGRETQRAADIIKRIRDFVRKRPLVYETLQLNQLVVEALKLTEHDALERQIQVRLRLDPNLPDCRGDSVQLEQVIVNLVRNAFDALDATPPSARQLTITSDRNDDMIELAIQDSGPGFPHGGQDRVFDAFYTTKSQGLGLGLPIARTIVEAHGGRLWLESPDDAPGAVFRFSLPILEPAERSHEAAP